MKNLNENWDGIDRSRQKSLTESDLLRLDDDFTDLDKAANTIKTAAGKPNLDIRGALSYLRQAVSFLQKKDAQQQEFLGRIVRDLGSAAESCKDNQTKTRLNTIMSELKKHQK